MDFWFVIQFLEWDPDAINGVKTEGFGSSIIGVANVATRLTGNAANGNFLPFNSTGPRNTNALKMAANKDAVTLGLFLSNCPDPDAYSGKNYRACRLKVWSYASDADAQAVYDGQDAPGLNNIDDESQEFSLNWDVKVKDFFKLVPCVDENVNSTIKIPEAFFGTNVNDDERWNVSKAPCKDVENSSNGTYIGEADASGKLTKACLAHKFEVVSVDTDDYNAGSAPVDGTVVKCDLNCRTVTLTESAGAIGVEECYTLKRIGSTEPDPKPNDGQGAFKLNKLAFFADQTVGSTGLSVCTPGLYTCDPAEIQSLQPGSRGTCVGLVNMDEYHITEALTNALAQAGWGEGIGDFEITGFKSKTQGVSVTGGALLNDLTITKMKGAGHTRVARGSLPGGASSYLWQGHSEFKSDAQDRNGVVDSVSFWYSVNTTANQSFSFFERWRQEIEMDVNETYNQQTGESEVEYTIARKWDPQYIKLFAEKTMNNAASLKVGGNVNKMFEVGLSLNITQVKTENKNEWGNNAGSSSLNVGCSAYMEWKDITTGLLENWTDDDFKDKLKISIDMGSAGSTQTYSWENIKNKTDWTGSNTRKKRNNDPVLEQTQTALENGLFSVQSIKASYSIKKNNSWGLSVDLGTVYDPKTGFAFDADPTLSFQGKIPGWDKVKYTLDWQPKSQLMEPALALAYKPKDIQLTETTIGGQNFEAYASIGVNVDASPGYNNKKLRGFPLAIPFMESSVKLVRVHHQ